MRRALLLTLGRKELQNDKSVCPEFRGLSCVNGAECSNDAARGCKVCRCRSVVGPNQPADEGRPMTDPAIPPQYQPPPR
jgi:hypothetical protein